MAHARLSASAAHRWFYCHGSVRLSEGLPNKSSAAAAEGTLAHDIAARCLVTGASPDGALNRVAEIDGYKVTCDKEMVEGVQFYLDAIAADAKKGDETAVEFDLTPPLVKIHPDLGGVADFVRWRPKTKSLRVVDLKYGAGHLVSTEGNKQLLLYALGALLAVGKPAKEVTVTIVQPRIEHEEGRVRDWTFPAQDLLDFAADAEENASRTQDVNAPLVPGASQCQWCPARHKCPALEEKQHALVAAEFKEMAPYDPQALAKALDTIPLVEARIKAIREFAYAEAERGNVVPGYKLVAKRGTRKWIDDVAVRAWCETRGVEPFEEPKMRSPAQVEKECTKDQKKELADMTLTVSSGHALVPESDKRPAAHLALATDFAVIGGAAGEQQPSVNLFK